MTHFAPVGPLGILRKLPVETLGNYHLVIAPKVLEDEEGYQQFFRRNDHIIIDNGIIELGYPLEIIDLYHAARIVRANVVVLPDTIDDMKMTVKQARQNAPAYRRLDPDTDLMGVIQGKNLAECLDCAQALLDQTNGEISWFGVPRGLTPNLGSRVPLVRMLSNAYPYMKLHVLGFSENIEDDIKAAVSRKVKGLDAATPLWYGNRAIVLPPEPPKEAGYGRRPEGYWLQNEVLWEAEFNVNQVRKWLAVAKGSREVASDSPVVQNVPI